MWSWLFCGHNGVVCLWGDMITAPYHDGGLEGWGFVWHTGCVLHAAGCLLEPATAHLTIMVLNLPGQVHASIRQFRV
jgi:hypothetical protein